MKKKRLIILLSILAAVIAIGCFMYLYLTAAAEKEHFYEHCIFNEDANTVNDRLNMFPEQIELGSGWETGETIHFQDYSLILSGYDDIAIDKDLNNDYSAVYHVDNDKLISFRHTDTLMKDLMFDDSVLLSQVEKAAGKEINTEYDFWEALFYCTPADFSLIDTDKNHGVSILLDRKNREMLGSCYQFNNGVIKGFIRVITPGDTLSFVYFSNCEVSDSVYQVMFCNFSIEEVKDILSTITFDRTTINEGSDTCPSL